MTEQKISTRKTVVNDGKKYYIHPIYNNYGSTKNGEIMNFKTKRLLMGTQVKDGSRKLGLSQQPLPKKSIAIHKFVYECFYGQLPDNVSIIHKNGLKDDNRIVNLQIKPLMKKTMSVKQLTKNINPNIDYDTKLSNKEKISIDKAYEKMLKTMKRQNINPEDFMN